MSKEVENIIHETAQNIYKKGFSTGLQLGAKDKVPVEEITRLRNEMATCKTDTNGEKHILLTCVCMLDDLLESYTASRG